jgi:hypothetical protein
MKNAAFWDDTRCGSYKNLRFGGKQRLHYQGDKNRRARNTVSSIWQPTHAAKKYSTMTQYSSQRASVASYC